MAKIGVQFFTNNCTVEAMSYQRHRQNFRIVNILKFASDKMKKNTVNLSTEQQN